MSNSRINETLANSASTKSDTNPDFRKLVDIVCKSSNAEVQERLADPDKKTPLSSALASWQEDYKKTSNENNSVTVPDNLTDFNPQHYMMAFQQYKKRIAEDAENESARRNVRFK